MSGVKVFGCYVNYGDRQITDIENIQSVGDKRVWANDHEATIIEGMKRSFRDPIFRDFRKIQLWQDFSDEYDVADIGEDDFLKLVCTWGKLLTDGEFSYFVYDETFANAIVPNAIMPNAIILNVSLIYCLDTHKFLRTTMQGSESLPFSLPLSFKKKLDDHIAEIMLED